MQQLPDAAKFWMYSDPLWRSLKTDLRYSISANTEYFYIVGIIHLTLFS